MPQFFHATPPETTTPSFARMAKPAHTPSTPTDGGQHATSSNSWTAPSDATPSDWKAHKMSLPHHTATLTTYASSNSRETLKTKPSANSADSPTKDGLLNGNTAESPRNAPPSPNSTLTTDNAYVADGPLSNPPQPVANAQQPTQTQTANAPPQQHTTPKPSKTSPHWPN